MMHRKHFTTIKKHLFLLFAFAGFFTACNTVATEQWTVASEQADCVGVGLQKCLLIRHEANREWEFFYDGIDGFEYEPGYEYEIEVRKEKVENPAADQSSLRYVLVRILSKEQKQSEALPSPAI